MRQSKTFFKTHRDFPKDETALNARFLLRANFIEKLMAGVYSFLPLGWRVREKIINLIQEEMDALGAQEILMPALHPRSVWEVTGRWKGLAEIMYQFKDRSKREIGLGPTHEEIVVLPARHIISSYQDLPLAVYQIQTKFRDEPRAKAGLLRGREFTMKDLYSFHTDQISLNDFYEQVKNAYQRIFQRCSLKSFVTEASGGDFSKDYSHEFMVESSAGEDETILCRLCGFAQNKEIFKVKRSKKNICYQCHSGVLEKVKTIEVGNIFKLGTRFSEPTHLYYNDQKGQSRPVIMASYGIGIERLMGAVVEVHHDKNGIIWPLSIAPFLTHLLIIGKATSVLKKFADRVYNEMNKLGIETFYDDRENVSAGEKFVDADLIGLPWRLVVSEKSLLQKKIEIKKRDQKEVQLVKLSEIKNKIIRN